MKTYRVEYLAHGQWVPGNLVQMHPRHFSLYLQFLAGDRPLVSFTIVDGAPKFQKTIQRRKDKCAPTRLRCVTPNWSEESGYYFFNGESVEFVGL